MIIPTFLKNQFCGQQQKKQHITSRRLLEESHNIVHACRCMVHHTVRCRDTSLAAKETLQQNTWYTSQGGLVIPPQRVPITPYRVIGDLPFSTKRAPKGRLDPTCT